MGHTNSSHLYVATDLNGDAPATKKAGQVNVLVSRNVKGGKQDAIGVTWLASSSSPRHDARKRSRRLLLCDACDKYAEEALPDAERSWDRSLDLAPVTPCAVDVLSRHTLPGPETLPLVNPALGFDAIFVAN